MWEFLLKIRLLVIHRFILLISSFLSTLPNISYFIFTIKKAKLTLEELSWLTLKWEQSFLFIINWLTYASIYFHMRFLYRKPKITFDQQFLLRRRLILVTYLNWNIRIDKWSIRFWILRWSIFSIKNNKHIIENYSWLSKLIVLTIFYHEWQDEKIGSIITP